MEEFSSIEQISSGQIPGFLFPKLMGLEELRISPFDENSLGNICYYLHLNNKFRMFKDPAPTIDLQDKESIENAFTEYKEFEKITLKPGESIIGQTFEKIGLSEWLLGKLENTSSFGRVFINHASHGFSHPGHGMPEPVQIMLELTNLGASDVVLYPAKIINGKVTGTEVMRLYIDKLSYKAMPYLKKSTDYKLKMDKTDIS